jgi:hypothetical protein
VSKITNILVSVAIVLLLIGAMLAGFWVTGGKSLFLVCQNYLSKDIPDKTYSYQDFRDRDPREMLHGYYAGADASGFYMWTLSGLKRFSYKPDMSVYQYIDTCGLIKQLEEGTRNKNESGQNRLDESVSFDFDKWASSMKRGDYVWVKRVREIFTLNSITSIQYD